MVGEGSFSMTNKDFHITICHAVSILWYWCDARLKNMTLASVGGGGGMEAFIGIKLMRSTSGPWFGQIIEFDYYLQLI